MNETTSSRAVFFSTSNASLAPSASLRATNLGYEEQMTISKDKIKMDDGR